MNKNVTKIIILLVIIGLIAVGAVLASRNNTQDSNIPVDNTPVATTTTTSTDTNATSTATTTTTTATPTITKYSAAQVATHANKESCWSIIRGDVYDLTNWISKHPGGQQAILGICGIDATKNFDAQHKGQGRPEATLVTFKIGVLAQ